MPLKTVGAKVGLRETIVPGGGMGTALWAYDGATDPTAKIHAIRTHITFRKNWNLSPTPLITDSPSKRLSLPEKLL
jgi:hypothetical protein